MHAPLEGPGIIMREKHVLKDWHMEEGTHFMSLLRSFAKVLIYVQDYDKVQIIPRKIKSFSKSYTVTSRRSPLSQYQPKCVTGMCEEFHCKKLQTGLYQRLYKFSPSVHRPVLLCDLFLPSIFFCKHLILKATKTSLTNIIVHLPYKTSTSPKGWLVVNILGIKPADVHLYMLYE